MNIVVLYQDESLIICEKPVGISSESPGLPEIVSAITNRKVWPVHRLDQVTGGAIILAFSPDCCAFLQHLFQESLIHKEYLAVISGCPTGKTGCWKDLLLHDRKKNKSFVVSRTRAGVKEAECEWTVLGTAVHETKMLTLVRIGLHTGRTHQIRVQFSSRGFPLVGDKKYGSRIPSDTIALWSSGISFPWPGGGNSSVSVQSLPPSVFPWNMFEL